jgi:hypothetical protein
MSEDLTLFAAEFNGSLRTGGPAGALDVGGRRRRPSRSDRTAKYKPTTGARQLSQGAAWGFTGKVGL